jgi:hypothetical protein
MHKMADQTQGYTLVEAKQERVPASKPTETRNTRNELTLSVVLRCDHTVAEDAFGRSSN